MPDDVILFDRGNNLINSQIFPVFLTINREIKHMEKRYRERETNREIETETNTDGHRWIDI